MPTSPSRWRHRQGAISAVVALWLAWPLGPASVPSVHAQGDGLEWTVLFDGTSLDGWSTIGDANWEIVDGVVQADQGNGFLVTAMNYGDFELTLEFWVSADANSGVFIRCDNPQQVTAANAYEVNIYDTRPDPTYRTGGIVDVAEPVVTLQTGGQWNTYQITARGSRLTVVLNGTQTVDVEDGRHQRGPIALQYGAGTVKFRNVRIRSSTV